jgi:hypothetical protein
MPETPGRHIAMRALSRLKEHVVHTKAVLRTTSA